MGIKPPWLDVHFDDAVSTTEYVPFYIDYSTKSTEVTIYFYCENRIGTIDIEVCHVVEEIVLESICEDMTDDDAHWGVPVPVTELFAGDIYNVYYNDEYIGEYIAWNNGSGDIGIGNGKLLGFPNGDDNAPFMLLFMNHYGACLCYPSGGHHNIKITHIARHYHTVDEKYLSNRPIVIREYVERGSGNVEYVANVSFNEAVNLIPNGAACHFITYSSTTSNDYEYYSPVERHTARLISFDNGGSLVITFNDFKIIFASDGISKVTET